MAGSKLTASKLAQGADVTSPRSAKASTTRAVGQAAEQAALEHLLAAGLRLEARNFKTPGRGGGEIDLIMRDRDGTLVFVEVRRRQAERWGGAAASVNWVKQRRIVFAARHYLARLRQVPPCRFDVVVLQGGGGAAAGEVELQWLVAAFDAGSVA